VLDYEQVEVMAMPSRVSTKSQSITLEIAGSRIPADRFRKSINAFLSLIDEVVRDFSGSKHDVRWLVSVSPGSALMHFQPETIGEHLPSDQIPVLLETIHCGIRTIEKTSQRPAHFTDLALKKARKLAELLGDEGEGIDSIRIWNNGDKSPITTQTLANIDSLFGTASTDWGSIEGRLSEVSERGERHVYVYDRLLDRHIRCHLTEDLLKEMAPYWGKRVNVTGFIRYYSGGDIKDINVEEYEVFPDPHTLPGFDEVFGMFKEVD